MIETIKVKGKTYSLKFTAKSIRLVEDELNQSVFSLLGADKFKGMSEQEIKDSANNGGLANKIDFSSWKVSSYIVLFWACLQKHHKGVDLETAYEIYDDWMDEDSSEKRDIGTFISMIMNVVVSSSVLGSTESKSLEPNVPDYANKSDISEVVDAKK